MKIEILFKTNDTWVASVIRTCDPAAIHPMAAAVGLDCAKSLRPVEDGVDVAGHAVVSLAIQLFAEGVDGDVDDIGACCQT